MVKRLRALTHPNYRALAITKMKTAKENEDSKGARRERPNWGLALTDATREGRRRIIFAVTAVLFYLRDVTTVARSILSFFTFCPPLSWR
jgi:hypothetical protein